MILLLQTVHSYSLYVVTSFETPWYLLSNKTLNCLGSQILRNSVWGLVKVGLISIADSSAQRTTGQCSTSEVVHPEPSHIDDEREIHQGKL